LVHNKVCGYKIVPMNKLTRETRDWLTSEKNRDLWERELGMSMLIDWVGKNNSRSFSVKYTPYRTVGATQWTGGWSVAIWSKRSKNSEQHKLHFVNRDLILAVSAAIDHFEKISKKKKTKTCYILTTSWLNMNKL